MKREQIPTEATQEPTEKPWYRKIIDGIKNFLKSIFYAIVGTPEERKNKQLKREKAKLNQELNKEKHQQKLSKENAELEKSIAQDKAKLSEKQQIEREKALAYQKKQEEEKQQEEERIKQEKAAEMAKREEASDKRIQEISLRLTNSRIYREGKAINEANRTPNSGGRDSR